MNLSHYSRHPIEAVRDGDPHGMSGAYKPAGLWVSVDGEDDWPDWCQRNEFICGENFWHYRVTLAPDAKIWRLNNAAEVHLFTDRYGHKGARNAWDRGIDWPAVAAAYDGVIIAPYQWECRLDNRTFWYYGWDCASGVIWKARAIASIELLGQTTFVSAYGEKAA